MRRWNVCEKLETDRCRAKGRGATFKPQSPTSKPTSRTSNRCDGTVGLNVAPGFSPAYGGAVSHAQAQGLAPGCRTDSRMPSSARYSYFFAFGARAGFDHLQHARVRRRFVFALGGQRTLDRVVMSAGDHQLFGRELGDDFVAGWRHDDFFFDARGAPAVLRRPERFEREDHARLKRVRMIQRNQAADHWLFPDRQADAVAVLQSEGGLFVREAELLRLRPNRGNFGGGAAGANQLDGGIEVIAAALVSVNQGVG